jgi:polyisoprenyl-phosphate glycosyltransferase
VARVPYSGLPTARAKRLFGRSNMRVQDLIIHGFRALSVFSEIIGVRALAASGIIGAIAAAVCLPLVALPGIRHGAAVWVAGGTLAVLWGLAIQGLVVSSLFLFATLGSRSLMGFLPLRDYSHFVLSVSRLGGTEQGERTWSASSENGTAS